MPRDVSKRTGELWERCKQLAREGKNWREVKDTTGCSRTYAYEAINAVKAETQGEKPKPSEVKVEERTVEEEKLAPSEAVPAEKPTEAPTPSAAPAPSEEAEGEEEEIAPDLEDCKDLYAIPFETLSLIFNDEELQVSEERIQKQGARLFKLFTKYKWKLPLSEVLFCVGFAADLGMKIRLALKKREEQKKKKEGEKSGESSSEKKNSEASGRDSGRIDISSYGERGAS